MRRTGHWTARLNGVYLRQRSTQPILVWGERAEASSFPTRREAEQAVRLSGIKRSLGDVTVENVAQTFAGFCEWRRGEREPLNA